MANTPNYLATVSIMALGTLALVACAKPLTPQEICVAPETQSNVEDLLNGQAIKGADGTIKPDVLTAALQSLWKSGGLKLDLVTLKSVDHDTNKISCEGQVEIKLSDNQQKAMSGLIGGSEPGAGLTAQLMLNGLGIDKVGDAFHDGQASIPIQFQRQPSADGKTFVFSYERSDQLEAAVRIAGALQTLSSPAGSAAAKGAQPTTPDDARPEGSVHADGADQPASDTPANGGAASPPAQ